MSSGAIEDVLRALAEARARFVVVGGVAVVLQGHPRLTLDLDLVVALEPENARRALGALEGLGFRPRAPVSARDFANPDIRAGWIRDKGLRVFSLWSDSFPGTDVDLFVDEPIPYDELESAATEMRLATASVRVASIPHLIQMKREAGRPQDLEDVRVLAEILAGREAR